MIRQEQRPQINQKQNLHIRCSHSMTEVFVKNT